MIKTKKDSIRNKKWTRQRFKEYTKYAKKLKQQYQTEWTRQLVS